MDTSVYRRSTLLPCILANPVRSINNLRIFSIAIFQQLAFGYDLQLTINTLITLGTALGIDPQPECTINLT